MVYIYTIPVSIWTKPVVTRSKHIVHRYIRFDMWDGITYQFPHFNDTAIEVWELVNNFISHFIKRMLIYPDWD